MTIADQLDTCADYIEEHGWTRGSYEYRGRVCASGAMIKVAEDVSKAENWIRFSDMLMALHNYLGLENPDNIARWNDDQKSRKPVIKAFRDAAAALREEG